MKKLSAKEKAIEADLLKRLRSAKRTIEISRSETSPWKRVFAGNAADAGDTFTKLKKTLKPGEAIRMVSESGAPMLMSFGSPIRVRRPRAVTTRKKKS